MDEDIRELDLSRWHFQYDEPMPAKLNWRMLLEAGFETYRVPFLHAKSAAKIFYSNIITFDSFGPRFRISFPRRSIDELRDIPEPE
jgi:hypothetical protein